MAETRSGASRRGWLLAASALLVLVVVAASVATLAPADGGQGMRGIAARVRGADWERAEVGGASAEFPGVPVRHATVPGPGLPRAGERLVSARAGLRTELLAAEVADRGTLLDGSAVAQGLVDGYAATSGGRVLRRTPLYLDGAPGVDAVVDADDGTIRVRATVAGTTAYLLAVVGPPEAFQRFTGSFRLEP